MGVVTIMDLLLFFPRTYEDKRQFCFISDIRTDQVNNIKGRITNIFHRKTRNHKHLSRATFTDKTGQIEVIWFNQPYLQRVLRNNQRLILSGKATFKNGKVSLMNPLYEPIQEELIHTGRIVPIYHQTEGITSKWLRDKLKPLMEEWITHLEEYLPESIIKEHDLISFRQAVKEAHFPTSEETLTQAKKRLAFDELFLIQLKALQQKWFWQNISEHERKDIKIFKDDILNLISELPFELTNAQKNSINEILTDLKKPFPMTRLLQGDVGSGKTIVAGAALFTVLKSGYQCALMAPTEILARQHYSTIFKLLSPYGYNIQFISGSTPDAQKKNIIQNLANGTTDLIIGTHSIIQETVKFHNLGFAIIDEQHRFGVKQRNILKTNGSPHLLSLSATPIPRTLAMTLYGDQDLSIIDEMPAGRKEIITRVVTEKKRIDAYRWIEDQVLKGQQAFVICPLIDESDVLEVKSAIQEHERLSTDIFPELDIGLLHGKMRPKEKDEIMQKFKNNEINILVSTSVIEVGIDIPNATIMIIEGAERFGLSQLHQFRGRVGRGDYQSYCFLFPHSNSETARKRLSAMVEHSSGFKLAEIDLEIRGPGEIYGVKQSGIPDLKMASLTDSQTISIARAAAQGIIDNDPLLEKHPKILEKIKLTQEVYTNT